MTVQSFVIHAIYIGAVLLTLPPPPAWSAGFDGPGTAPCSAASSPQGRFSPAVAEYHAAGQCTTYGSLGASRTFPYTVNGKYAKGVAEEIIEIVPPSTSEPSHPSGKWHTQYSCSSDPWLTPDGPPFEASLLRLKCPIISRTGPTPAQEGPRTGPNGNPLPTIGQLFALWGSAKPMTAWTLTPAERQGLVAKRDADFAEAKRKEDQHLKAGIKQKAPFRMSLAPVVLSPINGQGFFTGSPVPIKLAPPKGLREPEVTLDGTPVKTGRIYDIGLEHKLPDGTWAIHSTGGSAVRAVDAESMTGFVGFGAGASPVMKSFPGAWRVRARLHAPIETGWSDWVEFRVMPPPSGNSILQAPMVTNPIPIILAPTANAKFFSSTAVPIKITPPKGLAVTSFNIKIESKNAQGVWTTQVTNLLISMAEASSLSGYLGWGAPGNGKGAAMIAGPGTYRISAQVASPRQTGWSPPVEFGVMAPVMSPNKAIQRAPKMFGQ